MTASYELFDHTADFGVIGTGDSLGEALEGVFSAMFEKMTDVQNLREVEEQLISIQEEDLELEDQVVNLFSKFLIIFESEGFLGKRAAVRTREKPHSCDQILGVDAVIYGERYDPKSHSINVHFKAVTYHHIKIWDDKAGWHVRILLDV